MELMEATDDKSLLVRKTAKHKQQLQDEFSSVTQGTEKIIVNAIVISGTLAVTYIIARQFFKSKTKRGGRKKLKKVRDEGEQAVAQMADKSSQPGIVSQIGSALAAQATVFLLDLAKDKLSGYLKAQFDKGADQKNEHP